MKISNIRDAPLLRAYLLINQEKNKKGFKAIQPEISKMSEVFGTEFDRNLHLTLFNDIDFKDLKNIQNSQNPKKRKIQYFLQDFPQFIERNDFIEIFSRILMDTKNTGSAQEIFNGLNKTCKLNIENQMKLILSFFMSDTERYQEEAKTLLFEKCKEIYKEKKLSNLTESTVNTLLTVLDLNAESGDNSTGLGEEENTNLMRQQIDEYTSYFMSYEEEFKSSQTSADDIRQISDLDKILESGNEDPIEIEKLFFELGPFILNNKINISSSEMINADIDIERLGTFIIFMLTHPSFKMDEELKELNRIFLDSLTCINNEAKEEYKTLLDKNSNKELSWDLEALYKLFKKNLDSMDSNQVLNSLDDPSFCIKEKKSFDFLIDILTKLHILKGDDENNNDKFFKNLIFTKWNNEINQIEFIDFLINNKDISENSPYGLRKYNGNKISEEMDSKINSKHHSSNSKNQYLIDNWRIIDLIEILLNLSKGEFYNSVKEIFKWPIQNIPELLSLVLVNINPEPDAFLYDELTYEVIPQILANKNTSQDLINEIWNANKDLVILIMAKMWENQQDLQNLTTLFDIANNKLRDSLSILVNSKYYNFSVNLGIYASKRDYMNLEQWIKERINKVGDDFIEALLNYIKQNVIQQCSANNSNNKGGILEKAQLTMESLGIILDNIFRICNTNKLSQKTKNFFQEIYKSVFEIYDYLQVQPVNSEEIEKETNQIYTAMFNGEISVDNVINKLINYKKSTVQKENEIYALVIHYLFDEYRFYYQYPEKEIKKIAELFGKAINNKLIDGIIETIALKFIYEGIKTGKGAMYNFGVIALSQFIGKISHWPNFMNSLIDLPQITNEKDLYQKLLKQFNESKNKDKGERSDNSRGEEVEFPLVENDKNVDAANNRGYSVDKDDPSLAKNYDNLRDKLSGPPRSFVDYENLSDQIQLPDEIVNKIRFIFGSLNKNNSKEKVKEIKSMIKEDKVLKWFSQYFVTTKLNSDNISSFPLYDEIFTQVENKDLNKVITKDTICYIHYILDTETLSETKTKDLLKSMGNWLGIFILKKNRPILAKDLDFKELIFNSYVNGKLLIIIPFICRVFSFTAKSKVFHYKNPWINAILCLLNELHSKTGIDNSIKEEIKELFKTLEIDFNSFPITKDLEKYHPKILSDDFSNAPNHDVDQELLMKKISDLDDYINNLLGILNSDPKIASRSYQRSSSNNISNNNTNENTLNQNDVIKMLTKVMCWSVQYAIPNIIDLYVNNPIKSAIAIVNKDFMFEPSEAKYRLALDNTMKTLVKSLSVIGSHEKLKKNIDAEFTKYIKSYYDLGQDTINKIIFQPNSEYLYIGLDYIQNYIKKEAPKILYENSKVKDEIEKRRQLRNNNNNNSNNSNTNNSTLVDSKRYKEYKKFFKKLPPVLQPNEKCITDNVYKVYENFGKIIDTINIYEDSSKSSFLNTVYRILKEVLDNTAASKARCNNRDYDLCMKNIENVSYNTDNNCEDDQQLVCLEKIIIESKISDVNLSIELSLNTLEYAINSIKNGNNLLLNVYSHILKGWVKLHNEISFEITKNLLSYEDIFIKYKTDLHINFFKKKIINYSYYENYFIDILNTSEPDLLAKEFLKQLFNTNSSIKASFPQLAPFLYDENSNNFYNFFNKKSKIASHILEVNTNPIIAIMKHGNNEQNNFIQFRDFSTALLDQLLNYYRKNSENFDINKMRKLLKNDFMAEDKIPFFILLVCETCIKGPFEGQKISANICCPENVSLLIYIIIFAIKKDKVNKMKIFNNILNAIVTFFHKDYIKSQKNFNQRAYYKLFYNLIYLLDHQNSNDDPILDSEYKKIHYLIKICDILRVLSPINYPGFTMAWLDLISANHFVSNFLEPSLYLKKKEKNERYEKYLSLIIEALTYLDSFSDKNISNYNYVIFLENFYKFIFILCNSFPDFVSNYYYLMLTSLTGGSSHFLQLKNIILSATPSNVTLPTIQILNINLDEDDKNDDSSSQDNNSNNNSTNNSNSNNNNNNNNSNNNNNNSISSNNYLSLKKSSTLPAEITNIIEKNGYKELIDKYKKDSTNENVLVELVKALENIEDDKEINKIFNAIVIYWGLSKHKHYTAEKEIKSKEEFYSFFSYLINNLNENHRDILIHALLNALRFPCTQTASYSLLYQELFTETKNEEIEEHLLNNLLERLLYKPYPWGLKFTMVNLFEKEKFNQIKKNYAKKNNLADIIEKISVKCFENNLDNYFSITD